MTEFPERVEHAFARHGGFERTGPGTYEATTTPFDATVEVEPADPPRLSVTVRAPTLSAVAVEDVAGLVEEGWLETFERRMAHADMPLSAAADVEPSVDVRDGTVVVAATVEHPDPKRAVDDAGALVDYVEGTYMEGVVPGYTYRDPVAALRGRALEEGK